MRFCGRCFRVFGKHERYQMIWNGRSMIPVCSEDRACYYHQNLYPICNIEEKKQKKTKK